MISKKLHFKSNLLQKLQNTILSYLLESILKKPKRVFQRTLVTDDTHIQMFYKNRPCDFLHLMVSIFVTNYFCNKCIQMCLVMIFPNLISVDPVSVFNCHCFANARSPYFVCTLFFLL